MVEFSKDMSILEALGLHPEARHVFESYGMTCCMCMGAVSETVEAGAIMHAVDPNAVIEDLNRLVAPAS